MKELSIEEKAQRYDEALKEAVIAHKDEDRHLKATLERIFPELKESEDERIRKDIIVLVKDWWDRVNKDNISTKEQMIAWLEKQDYTFEIKEGHWYKCTCDYMLNDSDLMFKNDRLYYCRRDWRLKGEIDERNVKDIGVNGYKSFFRPATNQEIKDWLKQSDANKEYWRGYNEGKQCILDKYATLEKQSEQKPKSALEAAKEEKIDNQNCIKLADKVEPKFKVGDWVVDINGYATLEKAMADAGYTLDFEKKELKKITDEKQIKKNLQDNSFRRMFEQKPAWSEEDERIIKRLTSLWSEVMIEPTCCRFGLHKDEVIHWLKSLRPQNRWKPSEGQLECLGYAIEKAEKDWSPLTNNRIYLTLKALKGQLEKLQ